MSTTALAGFVSALLPPEHGGPDPDTAAGWIDDYLRRLPPQMRAGVLAGVSGYDVAARLRHRRALRDLGVDDRERLLDLFCSTTVGADALDGLKGLAMLVVGAHTHAEEMSEQAAASPPARPDPPLAVTSSLEWPTRSVCDVVVIGSGAGGAMAARTLARAGLDVVVVEEGRRHGVDEFRDGHPLERFADMYRGGTPAIAVGNPPVVLPIGRGVGGTTLVNSGTCYRTPDAVLTHWRRDLGIEVADPTAFGRHLDDVWATIGVGPVPLDVMGRNGRTMLRGAEALGWASGPLQRNAPGCEGCCQCAIGCPRNAKAGVHLNALPQACEAGARIVSELRVRRIEVIGGRAAGVVGTRPDGSRVTVHASRVVVACGATETPLLLRRSGLGRHPEVGRNLALHPAVAAAGRFDEDITAWQGVLQSAAVEEFHESDRILVEATSTPPGMGSMALPGHGRALLRELDEAHHNVTLGAMIGDGPWGAVHGRSNATVSYRLPSDGQRRLLRAVEVMGEVLFASGAHTVITGLPGAPDVSSPEELHRLVSGWPGHRVHVAAFHPTGTVRMGADAQWAPVAPDGSLRGVDGVWVADASAVPTCPDVNPQVTIMALALAVADRVADAGL